MISPLATSRWGGFQRVFEDLGGRVVKKLWPPIVTPDYTPYLAQLSGVEAIGLISASFYTSDFDTPSNKKFAAGMVRDYGNLPGLGAASLYINGMVVEAALEKTGGKTDDKDALIAALRAVSLDDTPRGPFHFDHLGNIVGNIFIRRCEKRAGRLVNTTVKTYENVSQFWTYDEKWFLAQPVYSRDYPPPKS